jgi:hypothetical protein
MSTAPSPSLDEVPSYQKLMLPLLRFAADGQIHTVAEAFTPSRMRLVSPSPDERIVYQTDATS